MEKIITFLDTYNLPWFLLALLTWLVIYISCSLKEFLHGLPVGLWTAVVGGVLEKFFIDHKFWTEEFIMIQINGLDLFVIIGPFFALGIVLIRFLPKESWQRVALIIGLAALGTFIEFLATKLGFLVYNPEKWIWVHSIVAYILGLMSALGFYYIYSRKSSYY